VVVVTAEQDRLRQSSERSAHWKRWGPYLSERAWGTVREDYSPNGTAWNFLPHDHARSKAYRWNEDGLGGICDRHQKICFAVALWNGRDPILKERAFGLSGPEGNHGEDAKEQYFYLDSTPTHSYMKYLYKYPQNEFPYGRLADENRRRDKNTGEFELLDTGIFNDNRYFDVFVEYAKGDIEDILIRITAVNRGPDAAKLHVLPTLWFRNTWAWNGDTTKPVVRFVQPTIYGSFPTSTLQIDEETYGRRWLYYEGSPPVLFCENETNRQRLYGSPNRSTTKDGINEYVVHGRGDAVNADRSGTKAAIHYTLDVPPGASVALKLRLTDTEGSSAAGSPLGTGFDRIFSDRQREAGEFYGGIIPTTLSADAQNVMRQAFAGYFWSKQYYHYVIKDWLDGDPGQPPPPHQRVAGRNGQWRHLFNADVVSMPDKWEYPYYCTWDTAFHCVAMAPADPDFAKEQLVLLLREWYMHPNGQLPAYEWNFDDVNTPVHAWAALRVFQIERKRTGHGDISFLERVFHKLLLNFTWWVNRKDSDGKNIFQGGFLGMDNIGVFDRSAPLPTGGQLEQSDGTSWMAMYCLNLLAMARELVLHDSSYEDVASKFWEHFIYIAHAMNHRGNGVRLWDEQDGFFYDVLHLPNGDNVPLRLRSLVGLVPLFAVETVDPGALVRMPNFQRRLEWFVDHRPDLVGHCACMRTPGSAGRRMLAVVDRDKLRRILRRVLDENEFLSPYGVRSVSRYHRDHPYEIGLQGTTYRVNYDPAESTTGMFGGNSNWRGPVWFPMNYLLIESLQKFHRYLGDEYLVECPTGSGRQMTLWQVAAELSHRLTRLFLRGTDGRRPVHGGAEKFRSDPHWRDLVLFYEYFHGDTGAGLGASHQTGWTGLAAKLLLQNGE
jgi:hypothetical protein